MSENEQNLRSRRARQTMDQIIDAAEKLFQKSGFAATSMSQVANEAGVTKSLIHHHFGSKEKLWDAVCGRNQKRMKGYISSILEATENVSGLEFITKAFIDYFSHIESNPGFSKLQTWVAAEERSQRSMQLNTLEQLEKRIEAAQKEGVLRDDIAPRYIIYIYWSTIEHWHSNRSIYAKRFGINIPGESNTEYLQASLKIFLEGIKNPDKKD